VGPGETPSDDRGCNQVTPEIGVTATAVIDRSVGTYGTIYEVAMSKSASAYHQRLHALNLATGQDVTGSPIEIQAAYENPGSTSNQAVLHAYDFNGDGISDLLCGTAERGMSGFGS
jgi:hypothetical protein